MTQCKNSRFPKRAGTSVEASVGRGELFPLSCPKAVGCHSERQFSFSNGDNGWGWGGVLCIVFYVCLLVLYLLYIIIIMLLKKKGKKKKKKVLRNDYFVYE